MKPISSFILFWRRAQVGAGLETSSFVLMKFSFYEKMV